MASPSNLFSQIKFKNFNNVWFQNIPISRKLPDNSRYANFHWNIFHIAVLFICLQIVKSLFIFIDCLFELLWKFVTRYMKTKINNQLFENLQWFDSIWPYTYNQYITCSEIANIYITLFFVRALSSPPLT